MHGNAPGNILLLIFKLGTFLRNTHQASLNSRRGDVCQKERYLKSRAFPVLWAFNTSTMAPPPVGPIQSHKSYLWNLDIGIILLLIACDGYVTCLQWFTLMFYKPGCVRRINSFTWWTRETGENAWGVIEENIPVTGWRVSISLSAVMTRPVYADLSSNFVYYFRMESGLRRIWREMNSVRERRRGCILASLSCLWVN